MKLLCIVLILVVAAAFLIWMVKLRGSQSGARSPENANKSMEKTLSETPKGGAPGEQDETDGRGETARSGESAQSGESTHVGESTHAGESAQSGESAPTEESSQPAETAGEKLQTLDGVAAGTIVTKDELDTEHMEKYFQSYEIKKTGAVYKRINGKSYRENPNIGLEDLRYIKVLHYNFDHQLQVGELIVNKGLAEDILQIFRELYDDGYEIQSMHLVDDYWTGDGEESDSASIEKNNSSAFNYRPVTGGKKLSNHAYGFAIDINPQQNPYVSYRDGTPHWEHKNADGYIDRTTGKKHMITHEDLAFRLFKKHGFTWGGDWNQPKDYQHFEKKLY